MNQHKITLCGFCIKDAKPLTSDGVLYCPFCRLPQFPGLEYLPDALPATGIYCSNCQNEASTEKQIQATVKHCGESVEVVIWICSICNSDNFTTRDLTTLEAEIIGEGDF